MRLRTAADVLPEMTTTFRPAAAPFGCPWNGLFSLPVSRWSPSVGERLVDLQAGDRDPGWVLLEYAPSAPRLAAGCGCMPDRLADPQEGCEELVQPIQR